MTGSVAVMAVAFFGFSAVHLYRVTQFIEAEHGQDVREQVRGEMDRAAVAASTNQEVVQRSLLLLEADVVDKRYHQASALLMSRIWSRQLAFITGMVMAFLGSVFVLGKLSESTSNISGEGAGWKVAIGSASPGIILSAFGTIIVIASLLTRATLDVADGAVYVSAAPALNTSTPAGTNTQTPLSLDELEKLGSTVTKTDGQQK